MISLVVIYFNANTKEELWVSKYTFEDVISAAELTRLRPHPLINASTVKSIWHLFISTKKNSKKAETKKSKCRLSTMLRSKDLVCCGRLEFEFAEK